MSLAPAWTLVRRRSLRVMRRHAPYRRADGPALIQPMVGGLLRRPALLLGAACVLLVLGFQLWITPTNPPGFIRDEASFSYNAYTIGHSRRDQDGGLLPLYFVLGPAARGRRRGTRAGRGHVLLRRGPAARRLGRVRAGSRAVA